MKRLKDTQYVKGYLLKAGKIPGNDKIDISLKIPPQAAVCNGFSAVFVSGTFPAVAEFPTFDLILNNELIVSSTELLSFAMVSGNAIGNTTANVNTFGDPYHSIDRPLSGSDELRVRFEEDINSNFWFIYLHLFYQPVR